MTAKTYWKLLLQRRQICSLNKLKHISQHHLAYKIWPSWPYIFSFIVSTAYLLHFWISQKAHSSTCLFEMIEDVMDLFALFFITMPGENSWRLSLSPTVPPHPLLYLSPCAVRLKGAHQISALDLIMLGVSTTPAAISHTRWKGN